MSFSRIISSAFSRQPVQKPSRQSHARRLALEPLEPRIALAVTTYSGALDGKIVYTSGGHGWEYTEALGRFATGRSDSLEVEEAFGNQDQMTLFADYILRAGGTVVPMRPVGHQTNERVLDNDSPGVTFSGAWSVSGSSVFYDEDYGASVDTEPYRSASVSAGETAVATYTPNIPVAGFYPVYTWVLDGANRTTQLYRIKDSGGVTEIRVDHRLVGKGWVYLGTYHFNAGSSVENGSVQISNQSGVAGNVIADAIRFGNGMGDMRDGPSGIGTGSVSTYRREDEASLLWTWRAIGQGTSAASVIGTSNISAPSRMAEHMNAAPFGTSVYIGFHSNAGGGRGARGLITDSGATPHQAALALYTGRQINEDMQLLDGQFEYDWDEGLTHTYTDSFGEIDEGAGAEMDMTIIEVAFHDSTEDSRILRDPKGRDQIARSTYDATVEYFDNWGGLNSPLRAPAAPQNTRAVASSNGNVTVSWNAGPVNLAQGGAAAGFRVYFSRNGYGFYDFVQVANPAATSYTIPAAQLDGESYYFKVVAYNTGGESPHKGVAGVRKNGGGGTNPILVVDGFDRYERSQNVRYPYAFTGDGLVDRVWARYNNSFDYVIQAGEAIEAYQPAFGPDPGFDFVTNDAVIGGQVNLANYQAVIWLSGEESTANDTFNATEQTLVTNYLNGGGKFFVSGAEIGWDLDAQGGGAAFYNNQLKADYSADDGGSYAVAGVAGSIFQGVSVSFDNGTLFYDTDFPDRLAAIGGSTVAMNYSTPGSGGAAIQYAHPSNGGRVVNFGFPFETITTAANRALVMDRVLKFFAFGVAPPTADFDSSTRVDALDFLAWQRGFGKPAAAALAEGDGDHDGAVDADDYNLWAAAFGEPAAAAADFAAATATGETALSSGEVASFGANGFVASPEPLLAAFGRSAPRRDDDGVFQPLAVQQLEARARSSFANPHRAGWRTRVPSAPSVTASEHCRLVDDALAALAGGLE